MLDVYPIAYTKPDWQCFIRCVQESLGTSPTRGLDDCRMDPQMPASYLATLDFENSPNLAIELTTMTGTGDHFFFTFLLTAPLVVILPLYTDVKILRHLTRDEDEQLYILTASINQWKQIVVKYCHQDQPQKLRLIMNRIMNHLETAGFRELWANYDKTTLTDKTFVLK